MCVEPTRHSDLAMPAIEGYGAFRDALLDARLLVATGVRGLYGRSGLFEAICEAGEDWSRDLRPAEVMMTPAICYPLYPTIAGQMPEGGRRYDLLGFAFRH